MTLEEYFTPLATPTVVSSTTNTVLATNVIFKRALPSITPGSKQDCGDVCVYPTEHNGLSTNVTIALCASLPLAVAVIVLIILHRRHINRLRLEDLIDKNDERDYGNNYPLKGGLKRTETEKTTFPGPLFDDPPAGSSGLVPYLNAPEMSRSSAHSLARTIASTEDRYRLQTHIPKSNHPEPLTPSIRSDRSSLHDYNLHHPYNHYEEQHITRKPLLGNRPGSGTSHVASHRPDDYSPSQSGSYPPSVEMGYNLHNNSRPIPGQYHHNNLHHDHAYGSPHQEYQDMYDGHIESLPYPATYDSNHQQNHNEPLRYYVEEDPVDLQAPRRRPGLRRSLSVPSRESINHNPPSSHALPVPPRNTDHEDEKAQRVKSIYREYFDDLDVPDSNTPRVPEIPSRFTNGSSPNRPLPRPHQPGPRNIINPNQGGRSPQPEQARKPLQPLKPLTSLPTPHKMENDPEPIGFAPPRRRQVENPENKSTPAMVLSSSYSSLSDLPSPSGLRKSSAFTTLDFAPKPRFLTQEVSGDSDSIRSARTNTSLAAVQNGAGRLVNVPSQLVSSRDRLKEQLKPSWDLRKSIVTNNNPQETVPQRS